MLALLPLCSVACSGRGYIWTIYISLFVSHFLTGLIVVSLIICWIPNQVRRLMTAVHPKSSWTLAYLSSYVTLHPVADTFFYLSSVINPFLYNLSSSQFRKTFLQVLLCRPPVEHVNRRALSKPWSAKSSMHPLVPKLRNQQNSPHDGTLKKDQTSATSQGDSGVGASSAYISDGESIKLASVATQLENLESEIWNDASKNELV